MAPRGEPQDPVPQESEPPELRDHPPWVMEEMIAAEADLPRQIAAQPETPRLGELLAEAVARDEPIVFTGCGTSEHASKAAAAVVKSRWPLTSVAARDAFETRLDPPGRGLVVAVSHEAGTWATIAAATAAGAAGAAVVLITARPERVPTGIEPIPTPRRDRSWCHTIGYASPFLVVALALDAVAVARSEALIRAELDARPRRREDAGRIADCTRLLAVGSGVDGITAAELALKIEEAAHVPTTPLGIEKVLHGHLPAADNRTGIVLLRFDPTRAAERDERAANVADAAAVLDLPLITLRARSPAVTPVEALVAGALALQLLSLELTHVLGTNPDRIRREQEPYRLAAQAAQAG